MAFKYKRSGGVPVTATAFRAIQRGNGARDRMHWRAAADAYRAALANDPGLAHIWVQLGHALKEAGDPAGATAAYTQATSLRPNDADPFVHLGHLARDTGDHAAAARHYAAALRNDPTNGEALATLPYVLPRITGTARAPLLALLHDALDGPHADQQPPAAPAPQDGPALAFDVSDLVRYFSNARLPTGIQRVQIQVVRHALGADGTRAGLCCLVEGREGWVGIAPARFLRLAELSGAGGDRKDPDWVQELYHLHLHLALAGPFAFPRGATLVNLGSSWQMHNYNLCLRDAKARYGIRYVPLVYDLIAVLMPSSFDGVLVREYAAWVAGLFDHADHYLAISENTRRDLIRAAAAMGRTLDLAAVTVVPLDADFRTPDLPTLPDTALSRWGLANEPFVLMVGTLEPRKGHAVALDAWAELIRRPWANGGSGAVPRLVFAGKRGWMNGGIFERLEDPVLAARVLLLPGLSDAELALLYRACLFTLYPSSYEGWGLPVTEALCHGKAVVTTDAASLPEAGGPFAVYVPPGEALPLADAAERLIRDAPYRQGLERRIAAEFRPRTWSDIARQIEEKLALQAARGPAPAGPPRPPMAGLGSVHSLAFGRFTRLHPGAGIAETLRAGTGWYPPDAEGCRIRPDGGELAVGLPPGRRELRVGLLILAPDACDRDWSLAVRHGPARRGGLRRHQRRWITFDYPVAADGGVLRLRLRGETRTDDEEQPHTEERAVGVAALFIHEMSDMAGRLRVVEAIAMNTLDEEAALDEPGADAAADGAWANGAWANGAWANGAG